jgi:hypothetical protein
MQTHFFSFMCLNAVQCIESCKADKPPTRRTCYKTTSQVTDKEREVKAYFSGFDSNLANALNLLYLASPAVCWCEPELAYILLVVESHKLSSDSYNDATNKLGVGTVQTTSPEAESQSQEWQVEWQ